MSDSEPNHAESGEPERLLEQYLAGDTAAFESLVGMYQERLYCFLERLTGDSHLAEDVFQTTFVKVADRAADFDRRAAFSTWLFRIARNSAIDEMRRRRRKLQFVDAGTDDWREKGGEDKSPTPLERLEGAELQDLVRRALAEIPEMQREVFLLKEEAELGFQEIGDLLGCGRETAKSRFRLAVEKLRGALNRMGWKPVRKREAEE
ncbi:MAG: sigma-70 family RNA polymerase sigma factor [Planctomycetota bacterium]|jgi:RNA polymerase sigma-70 factor (ECF subfamily)|nr:sigma-70 family RNA polymerase sigma factor [Planctomycetota bacterium]